MSENKGNKAGIFGTRLSCPYGGLCGASCAGTFASSEDLLAHLTHGTNIFVHLITSSKSNLGLLEQCCREQREVGHRQIHLEQEVGKVR
jgi:hypothetical protein